MKIVQILNCTFPNQVGGAEVSASEIRKGLVLAGHSIKVLTLRTPETVSVHEPNTIEIPLYNIYDPWRNSSKHRFLSKIIWKAIDWFNIVALVKVLRIFTREKPNLVLTHNLKGFSVAPWVGAWLCGIPVVHVLHDYYLICSNCALKKSRGGRCQSQCMSCKLYSLPNRMAKNCVHQYVGVSEFVLNKHKEFLGLEKGKLTVINNVRTGFSLGLRDRCTDVATKKLRVGFIGRIESAKGIHVFLNACRRLGDRVSWLVAGTSGDAEFMGRLQSDESVESVRWMGQVSPEEFYSVVDCVVVPSIWDEPYPAVAFEPQLFGCAVIASAVGGIPEIVSHGHTGFLFESEDVDGLVEIIDRLDRDRGLLQSIVKNAEENSARFLDTELMVENYVRVIDSVARKA